MDTQSYDDAIFAMRDVVYKDYPFAIVREKLIQFTNGQDHISFIDTICSELGVACLNPISSIVNRATMIIAELAVKGGQQLSLRMCQKDFQDHLMYTLRRLTTKLGNLITMHPQVWIAIENRILNLYQYWNRRFKDQQGKYFHALQRYRILKQSNLNFPSNNPFIQQLSPRKPEQTKIFANPQLLNDVKQLIDWCNEKINEDKTIDIMNTACVRNIKKRSQQLHKIWTTLQLSAQIKPKVKQYYSSLRKLSKLIDVENQKKKLDIEKKYLEEKKSKIQQGSLKQIPIASPQKIDLFDIEPATQSPTKSPIKIVAPSISPTKASVSNPPQNFVQLINVNDDPQTPSKPIPKSAKQLQNQLASVFSSPQSMGSHKLLQTPKDNDDDQFALFSAPTTALAVQQQIAAVTLLHQDSDQSSTKSPTKQDDFIDLI